MNVLLLGKDGQVGSELQRTLLPLGKLTAVGRSDLNLEDLLGLNCLLNTCKPDIIVNAAAYTAVDKAEHDQAMAFLINADIVNILADYAKKNHSLLVHYSTDYVFDGQKTLPYLETDTPNPQNVYGASKRAGEDAIIQRQCNFLLFRTSWVFSVKGNNFIKTILKLARENDSLRVVSDQYGAPTSAELIADVTSIAISNYLKQDAPTSRGIQNGIYHLTASGSTTWHNLACYIVDKAISMGMALKLNSRQIIPISTREYPLPAKRPKHSILNTHALSSRLALHLPDWTVHVDRVMHQLTLVEKSA